MISILGNTHQSIGERSWNLGSPLTPRETKINARRHYQII